MIPTSMLAKRLLTSEYMRRKPVLSHSPLMFPTIPAIVVSVLVPAFFAQAQAQTTAPQSFEEDLVLRQKNNQTKADDKNARRPCSQNVCGEDQSDLSTLKMMLKW
jgi:hypothetical protein